MHTQAEGTQDSVGGFTRAFEVLRQTAQRAAEAAVGAVQAQANGVVDAYRAELRRALAIYMLCRAVLVFIWSAAAFAAVALVSEWWERNPAAASLWAAAGFVLLAILAAFAIWCLTRRTGPICWQPRQLGGRRDK